MSAWSVYMLRCNDASLYTGMTTDVDRRFAEHASGNNGAKCLRGRRPLELVFAAEIGERGLAARVEYRIKRMSRAEKLRLCRRPETLGDILAALTGEGA